LDARLCAVVLACAALPVFAAVRVAESSAPTSAAEPAALQRGRTQRLPQRRRTQPRRPAIDYSRFDHATPEHRSPRRECSSCHVIQPLAGAGAHDFSKQQAAKLEVTDFPDHPSCVECHRQQFFRGARPAICSNCHTVTGPRSGARFEFPKPGAGADFADVFPHNVHTDPGKGLRAFRNEIILGPKAHQNETCNVCHKLDAREFKAAAPVASPRAAGAAAATASPAPAAPPAVTLPAGTFMITQTSHATCFQCHWQKGVEGRENKVYAENCERCHDNVALRSLPAAARPAAAVATRTPAATTATAAADARPSPSPARPAVPAALIVPASLARFRPARGVESWPARVSPKFTHKTAAHTKRAGADGKEIPFNCTTCHGAVRKVDNLAALKLPENQVQLKSCASSECHTSPPGNAALFGQSVFKELRARSTEAKSDCAYCHLPPISLAPVPCEHYTVVYESLVREKKSTTSLEKLVAADERCKDAIPKKPAQ
jgi:hypothetical protein